MLEPYDGKLSRTVLRGLGAGNSSWLPDRVANSIRRIKMKNSNAIFLRNPMDICIHFILCIFLITITGCATGERVARLSPGISQADVVGTLGRPDGFRTEGDYTILKYTNRLISGWSWDRADYFVILKDNKVIEYGSGEVREKNVGGIHTIFIHQF